MSDTPGIKKLEDGKYSFLVGKHVYTFTTQLDDETFKRIVAGVQSLVGAFSPAFSQEERLLLALMALSHKLEEVQSSIESLAQSMVAREEIDP